MKINKQYFKFIVKEKRNYMILFSLLFFALFPALVIIRLLTRDYEAITSELFFNDQASVTALAVFGTFTAAIVPLIMFNYKNSKKSVDLYHAIPLTRKSLFILHTLVGYLLLLIPFTISYWTGYGILYAFKIMPFSSAHLFNFIRMIVMFAVVMMPSIFVSMNTGTLFDSIIYTGIALILPFMAYAAFVSFSSEYIFGYANSSVSFLRYISPITGLIYSLDFIGKNSNFNIIYWAIFGVLSFFVTMYIYKKWPSESSEEPVTNRYFFPLMASIVTAVTFLFLISVISFPSNFKYPFLSLQNLLIPTMISFLVFIILSIIETRSLKYIGKVSKRYIALISVTLGFMTLYAASNGFFMYGRVPKLENIQKIEVLSNTSQNDVFFMNDPYVFYDKQSMERIITEHAEILQRYKDDSKFFNLNQSSKTRDEYIESLGYKITNDEIHTDSLKFIYHYDTIKVEREFPLFNVYYDEFKDFKQNQIVKNINHPISDPNNEIIKLELFNSTMTQRISVKTQTDLINAIQDDLSTIDLIDTDTQDKIRYIINYEVKKEKPDYQVFQLNIDERFTKSIALIENNISLIEDTDFAISYIPINQNPHLVNTPSKLIQHDVFYDEQREEITFESLQKLENKVYYRLDSDEIAGFINIDKLEGTIRLAIKK